MSGDTFYIASIWRSRNESIDDLAAGMLKTLDAVSAICPYCETWEIPDMSRPGYGPEQMQIHTLPLTEVRDRLADFVRYGVSRERDGTPDPMGGYSLDAGNVTEDLSRYVEVSCSGAYVNPGTRTSAAGFHTSFMTSPDPAITAYPTVRALLRAFVQIWKPDHALAMTSDLKDRLGIPGLHFDANWIMYLSAPLAKRLNRSAVVPIVEVADGGVYLIATAERFDVDDQTHRAGALAIRAAVAPLNR
jgi:hypothetical protein